MAKKQQKGQVQLSPENYIRQKARNLPVYECRINKDWKDLGAAEIIIARQHTNTHITFGVFYVDLLCRGVKESMYGFNMPLEEFQEVLKESEEQIATIKADYILVHNIIYSAVDYAEELGVKSQRTYEQVTRFLLDEDTDEVEWIEIECGKDGRPVLVVSDEDSGATIDGLLHTLEEAVGEGNFDVLYETDEDEDEDEDEVENQ